MYGKSHGRRSLVAAVHGVARSRTWLSDFTFTFHFHALEKEMATHSNTLAWRIPGTGEPGGLPSMGSHRVRHDWSDLAAAVADHGQSGLLSCGLWRHLCSSGEHQVLTDSPSQVLEVRNYFSLSQLKSSPQSCVTKKCLSILSDFLKQRSNCDHPHLKPSDWFLLNWILLKWKLASPGGI